MKSSIGSQRPYSIRTRIKTLQPAVQSAQQRLVRDHIPLEQGLRHAERMSHDAERMSVRDHIPLEQGLRRLD